MIGTDVMKFFHTPPAKGTLQNARQSAVEPVADSEGIEINRNLKLQRTRITTLAPKSQTGCGHLRLGSINLFILISFIILIGNSSFALDSTDVLPRGVNSPSVRAAKVSGIDANFSNSGSLLSLHDTLSVEVDSRAMVQRAPETQTLINVLNSFGQGRYGDQLSLGTLHINSKPEIEYTAIVHAWGLTNRWTLGFGLPAIKYKNTVALSEEGSNIPLFQQAFGGMDAALDSGLARAASTSLVTEFAGQLSSKGYRPLESKSESLWGDLQIVSLYQVLKSKLAAVTHKLTLTLPTGKKEDPNDLVDLDLFGRGAIENQIVGSYELVKNWSINARLGVQVLLPDQTMKRVPLNEQDILPDQAGLESVNRQMVLGNSAAGSINWDLTKFFNLGMGYEFKNKSTQKYSGNSSRYYEGLSKNSDTEAHLSRFGMGFSTVKAYQAKKFALPFILGLELSDTFAGKNVPRETRSELSMTLFY